MKQVQVFVAGGDGSAYAILDNVSYVCYGGSLGGWIEVTLVDGPVHLFQNVLEVRIIEEAE